MSKRGLRKRIAAIETAVDLVRAAYHDDDLALMEESPEIRLGDALKVPDPDAAMEFALFEVLWMLEACGQELEKALAEIEADDA